MKKKLRFVVETTESIRVRREWRKVLADCPLCEAVTTFETPPGISSRSGLAEREIFRLVEANAVSFLETDRVMVCSSCLTNLKKRLLPSGPDRVVILRPLDPE